MWKLEAGVEVWRWLEARLVFQKKFRAHLLHSALIHHPVCPCWPGDCQHLIYPQSISCREEAPAWMAAPMKLVPCCTLWVTLLTAPDCQASVVTCYLPSEAAVARCQLIAVCRHQSCQERHNSQVLDETLHSYREQSKVSLSREYGPPTASTSCPLANGGKMVYTYPSSGGEGPPSLPVRNR